VIWKHLKYPQGVDIQNKVRKGYEPIDRVLPYLELPQWKMGCAFFLADYLPNGDLGKYTITEIYVSREAPCFEFTLAHELAHLIYDFGIEADENGWFEAIATTATYRALVSLLPEDEYDESGEEDTKMIRYLVDKSELFARAFSQYIAYASGSEVLQQEVDVLRRATRRAMYYPLQWEGEDFKPVYEALDKLFTEKKWK
jgi:hypothetical protein